MRRRVPGLPTCVLLLGALCVSCSIGEAGSAPPRGSAAQASERPVARAQTPPAASAPEAAQCGSATDPVLIFVLDTPAAVRARRAQEGSTPVVSEDAETVVFGDGRVVTSRLDGVGAHLSRLGWIERELVISSRFQRRGGAVKRRRG